MPSLIRHICLGRPALDADRSIRSFIGVEIQNPGLIAKLEEVQRELMSWGADLRPVERENLHITMRFLGDIPEPVVEQVIQLVEKLSFEPFSASLHGVGVFPKIAFPRVIWIGVERGLGNLVEIYQHLEEELRELGFRPEPEAYTPHVTLFRVRSRRGRAPLIEALTQHHQTDLGEFEVRTIQLKRSVLTPTGPIYSTLGETRR